MKKNKRIEVLWGQQSIRFNTDMLKYPMSQSHFSISFLQRQLL